MIKVLGIFAAHEQVIQAVNSEIMIWTVTIIMLRKSS